MIIAPDKKSVLGKLGGKLKFWQKKDKARPNDTCLIRILDVSNPEAPRDLLTGEGSWLGSITIGE